MSDTKNNAKLKKPLSKAVKISLTVLGILVLEAGGIAAAVKITELRNIAEVNRIENIFSQLNTQQNRLSILEKLPASVAENSKQISSNFNMLTSLSESLNMLKSETGNNKIGALNEKVDAFSQRIESVEENKSLEALVLSLALIIKENALYHRPFAKEIDILKDLSRGQDNISQDLAVLDKLRNTSISDNYELVAEYNKIVEDFSFEKPEVPVEKNTAAENKSTMAKSIELIKDTVAGINFEKVVVLKKDTKTNEQKLLMQLLGDLVKNYNFVDAITYINENPDFNNAENQDFINWQKKVKEKIEFEQAVSNITAVQLSALRQDIANDAIKAPVSSQNVVTSAKESAVND